MLLYHLMLIVICVMKDNSVQICFCWWVAKSYLIHIRFEIEIISTWNFHAMEPSIICRQRRRNSSISSLYSELPIDPDNDLRDPIISSGESTDDDSEEVLDFIC